MSATIPQTQKILIVDDHPLVRQGYAHLISNQADLKICGEAESNAEALRRVRETRPDAVIVDVSLKDGSGLELIKTLATQSPNLAMLVVSAHDEALFAERALQAGARGYVNKQEAIENLIAALRCVLAGEIYLSPAMTQRFLGRTRGHRSGDASAPPVEGLSDRELEIYELLGDGLTTRQIAARIHLSPKTVDRYRENIKTKLSLKNSVELVRHATQWVLQSR